jgi:hypothetical protein
MNTRQELIDLIAQTKKRASEEYTRAKALTPASKERANAYTTWINLNREAGRLTDELVKILPVTFEGYLGVDDEEVDRDEHGSIRETLHYVGCPNLKDPNSRAYGIVDCDGDTITEVLKANAGKFVRITIETVDIDCRKKCENCQERFKCFTTKVKN